MWQIALIGMVCAEFASQILAKEWSLRGGKTLAIAALVGFLAVNSLWLLALHNGSGMARGITFFSVSVMLFGILVGVLWYGESFSPRHASGALLGLVSVALLSF